ncbi:hypothetical protein DFA_09491 [Cavenderia fasciculata]|uniref:Uncharacterized protein n=1 Tax=Cavenderia fasciculata TaxID=261658 RepID=F4Q7S2_CACFS|nr:uncharacterized protein DFA_09491 [Cavenderia fasciculata]EGG15822.1 hypothetical protein DFA_09491 [Cavenderia fasciculata]|eukprot:XP_004352147.1 hypothetical protein DFA_09491 [Cavenderia fasciculata]
MIHNQLLRRTSSSAVLTTPTSLLQLTRFKSTSLKVVYNRDTSNTNVLALMYNRFFSQKTFVGVPWSDRDDSFKGTIESRKSLLDTIYTRPLQHLQKKTKEYTKLTQSGDLWTNHHNAFDLSKEIEWSKFNKDNLKAVDELSDFLFDELFFSDSYNSAVSHQSVQIEGYTLTPSTSKSIYESIKSEIVSFPCVDIPTLVDRVIQENPSLKSTPEEVTMFCRNIVAQKTILKIDGLTEEKVKSIHSLLVDDDDPQSVSINTNTQSVSNTERQNCTK